MDIQPESITVAGGLIVAVIALWRLHVSSQKRTEEKLDECEQDREELHKQIAGLSDRVVKLENGNH